MVQNTNKWMIATAVLAGLIIGIAIGIGISQLPFFKNATTTASNEGSQKNAQVGQELPVTIELLPVTDKDYTGGAKDPKITIVEYSDPECPFCKMFHETLTEIIKTFPNDVKWVYRHLPLDIHPKAQREAVAMECAGELAGQEGFWKFLDRLMDVTPANNGLDPKELYTIAAFAKLDKTKFAECLDSTRYNAKITAQTDDAIKNGGNGTPFSVIFAPNGKMYPLKGYVEAAELTRGVKALLEGK